MTSSIWLSSPFRDLPKRTSRARCHSLRPSFGSVNVLVSDWLQAGPVPRPPPVDGGLWQEAAVRPSFAGRRRTTKWKCLVFMPFSFQRHFFWSEPTDACLFFFKLFIIIFENFWFSLTAPSPAAAIKWWCRSFRLPGPPRTELSALSLAPRRCSWPQCPAARSL